MHNFLYIHISYKKYQYSFLVHKIIQDKLAIFSNIFDLYQLLCKMFCTKMFRYSRYTYCLQKDSTRFGLEVSAQFEPKNQQYLQRFLELFQLFINNFIC